MGRTINPEHIAQYIDFVNESPYSKMLGTILCELSEGYCKCVVNADHRHMNMFGSVHGGAYATMMDMGTYWPLYCTIPEDVGYTTISLDVDNLHGAGEGLIIIEGHLIKQGSTLALCEAEARDEQGKLLVHATAKQFLSRDIQPITAALAFMGRDPLPPKFI